MIYSVTKNRLHCCRVAPTQRTFQTSSTLLAKQESSSRTAESKEAFIAAQAKLTETWKSIQNWKLSSETPTPLVRWLNKIQDQDTARHNQELMDSIRAKFPEEAKKADNFVNSLSPGFLSEEMQREFPELNKKLNDLEVFEFLSQFIDPKDKDNAKYRNIRDFLASEVEKKEKLDAELNRIDKEEADLLAPHFPDYYKAIKKREDVGEHHELRINDPAAMGFETFTAELIQKLNQPSNPWDKEFMTREQFFLGVDPRSAQAMAMREEQWAKYQDIVKLVQYQQSMDDKPPELEPLLDAAMVDFQKVFRPSSCGKYIRFTNREQKRVLPEGWGGKLEYREFPRTNETSLLMRQPTLDAIAKLRKAEQLSFNRLAPKPSIFYGDGGTGKSACLQLVVYWARKAGWLVVNIKNGTKWVHSGGPITKSKLLEGCWDQPHLGVKFLGHMLDAHSDKLKEIPLRTQFTLGQFQGKTLFDLVEYGAALHEYACDTVYHFKKELERVIEYPVLIAIDDYNSLYNYNQRFREPETKRFKPRKLRNKHLTLSRVFMDCHESHGLINGTFVGALCRETSYRHFPIETHKNEDWIEVPGFTPYETQKMFQHYERTKYVYAETSEETRNVICQLCDGRPQEMWKYARAL